MHHLRTIDEVRQYLRERDPRGALQNVTDFQVAVIQEFATPEFFSNDDKIFEEQAREYIKKNRGKLWWVLEFFGDDVRIDIIAIKRELMSRIVLVTGNRNDEDFRGHNYR